jgi:thiol-disulfide isomerase/thioredoxin
MKAVATFLLLGHSLAFAALVADVRALLNKDDFPAAEQLLATHRKQSGATPEYLEAYSWLGRAALAQKRYDAASTFAANTRTMVNEALKSRAVDDEPRLPLALGASIEVHGQVLAAQGSRSEAVSFLKNELQQWHRTSIRTRIQKNIHLLSLVGTEPPPLDISDWLGPKPPAIASLKGKPVLLFFWAHWCSDCRYEGPILAQIRDKYASKGLVILGPTQYYGYVASGEEAPPAQEKPYIESIRRQFYAPLLDVPAPLSQENFRIYGASTTPTLVLLDRKGLVRMYHPGRMTFEELASEIDKVL